jgi:solute carrier family 20 (sodium-dependent phosphate transporter)
LYLVSNAFATSIGAKVITLKTACFIASIAELAGSIGLGGLVTESVVTTTLKKNILSPHQTMLVMFVTLVAVSLWLLLATWLKLPVSATHAVISSIIGATLVYFAYPFDFIIFL